MLAADVSACTISFYDSYSFADRRISSLHLRPPSEEELYETASLLSQRAAQYSLPLFSCAEPYDLSSFGIFSGACIDAQRLSSLSPRPVIAGRDKNQRPACGCCASTDIGAYNTCLGGCLYCYAVRTPSTAAQRPKRQDSSSLSLGY